MSKASEISNLINKHLFNKLSGQERQKLNEWIAVSEHNQLLFNRLTDRNLLEEKLKKYSDIYPDSLWKKTKRNISINSGVELEKKPEMMSIHPKTIYKLIVAAILVTLAGLIAAVYLIWSNT